MGVEKKTQEEQKHLKTPCPKSYLCTQSYLSSFTLTAISLLFLAAISYLLAQSTSSSTDEDSHNKIPNPASNVWSSTVKMAPPTLHKPSSSSLIPLPKTQFKTQQTKPRIINSAGEKPATANPSFGTSPNHRHLAWPDVFCDIITNRVVELHFPGMGLSCQLPDNTLGNLTELTTLSLRYNALPGDIFTLVNLRNLYLQNNLFSGQIPDSFSPLVKDGDFDFFKKLVIGSAWHKQMPKLAVPLGPGDKTSGIFVIILCLLLCSLYLV